jgi:hypothetical protein
MVGRKVYARGAFGGSASAPPSPSRIASSTATRPADPSVRGSSGSIHSVAFLAAESGM